MIQVILDTSFLISFADPDRPNHGVAKAYFEKFVTEGIPMWASAVVLGEFHVKQSINDLPLQYFRILNYTVPHALRAARLFATLDKSGLHDATEKRPIIINDLKIISQAVEEQIPVVLTEDKRTLSKMIEALQRAEPLPLKAVLLADGFSSLSLEDQTENQQPSLL